MILRKFYSLCLFTSIFVFPIILRGISSGTLLSSDNFVENHAYINNLEKLFQHFLLNLMDYLFFVLNPIFIFFIVAYLVQTIMIWTVSDD